MIVVDPLVKFFKIFSLCFFFSPLSLSSAPLSDEEAEEIHGFLTSQWKPVKYKSSLAFNTIFKELDSQLWPALPESYEWRISENGESLLYKHRLAPTHKFDFVTYGTDDPSRFNFLSRWDGVTHHSFAYSRKDSPLTSDNGRKIYPISEFSYQGRTYMRGHCIDYLDTYGLSEKSKVGNGTIIESISTLDPRNYIPEPYISSSYWGETLRKNLVAQIRSYAGCYAQYMYYDLNPPRTDDETATVIPKGVYFLGTDENRVPLTSYRVPWSHKFSNVDVKWENALQKLQAPDNFFPSPFIYDLRKEGREMAFDEFPFKYPVSKRLPWQEYYRIVRIADHEVCSIMGKMILSQYLLDKNYDSTQIQCWLKRLLDHAHKIHEFDSYRFIDRSAMKDLIKAVADNPTVDNDNNFADHLRQLSKHDKDETRNNEVNTFSSLKPVTISVPQSLPFTEIDMNHFTKPDDATRAVIAQMHDSPRICILNLTTRRASSIASTIHAEFPEQSDRKKFSIQYTPNPKSPQTKGIRPKFTEIGVDPEKIDIDLDN